MHRDFGLAGVYREAAFHWDLGGRYVKIMSMIDGLSDLRTVTKSYKSIASSTNHVESIVHCFIGYHVNSRTKR